MHPKHDAAMEEEQILAYRKKQIVSAALVIVLAYNGQ
jgi:hypothetical protein